MWSVVWAEGWSFCSDVDGGKGMTLLGRAGERAESF
jgi:hypothetical protein